MSLTQRPRRNTHARLFFTSLFSSARHVSRRSRLWKAVGGAVAALLAVGMVATGVSLAASASTTEPTGGSTSAACVESPAYSYTYVAATASGVITVTAGDAAEGTPLCSPLYVRAATWTYDRPTNGGTPSWPQTLDKFTDVTVSAIGTFDYAAPDVNTCKQHDIYATFDTTGFAKLALPHNLLGSHNPSEPAFLHETLQGDGPNPTYSTDASTNCLPPTVSACAAPVGTTVITSLASLNLSDTRAQGHAELVHNGLHVWTTGPDLSLSKSAGYITTDFALKDAGVPALDYTTTSGASAGLNLTLYVNGVWKGNLVYEPLFAKYWINKAIAGLPAGPNPSYQLAYGTLNEILNAYANDGVTDLRIKAVGYSLGSGAIGDGVVNSITAGCTTYTFTTPPAAQFAVTDPHASTCENTGESTLSSWIFVALSPNASYEIDGTPVTTAYTSVTAGSHVVTVDAVGNVVLVGENNEWSGTHHEWAPFTAVDTSTGCIATGGTATPAVTQSAATCAASGSYTLSVEEPELVGDILWTVDGKSAVAGTYTAAAGTTVHVVATAVEGTGISGSETGFQEWTITIPTPASDCPQLKTLAFTGADGSMGGMLIFALFLLLGGAGVYTASRFRSRES